MPSHVLSGARRKETGTASVELIATIPLLLLAVAAAAQIAIAGGALWSAGIAARAGARAALVRGDPAAAARGALPAAMRHGSKVDDSDGVSVGVPVPRLLPGMPTVTVGAKTGLRPDGG